jgi:hypothetical protein
MPQPNLVPVSPSSSRKVQSIGVSCGTVTVCSRPLMVSEVMVIGPGKGGGKRIDKVLAAIGVGR